MSEYTVEVVSPDPLTVVVETVTPTVSRWNGVLPTVVEIERGDPVVTVVEVLVFTGDGEPGGGGEAPVYETRFQEITPELIYRGEAAIGSAENSPVWRIQKIYITYGAEITTTAQFPEGSQAFSRQWTLRDTYDYS